MSQIKTRRKLKKPLACSVGPRHPQARGQPLPLASAWTEAGVQQLGVGRGGAALTVTGAPSAAQGPGTRGGRPGRDSHPRCR